MRAANFRLRSRMFWSYHFLHTINSLPFKLLHESYIKFTLIRCKQLILLLYVSLIVLSTTEKIFKCLGKRMQPSNALESLLPMEKTLTSEQAMAPSSLSVENKNY